MTDKDGALMRQEAWIRAWCAVASANDCKKAEVAANWADACLAAFDRTFPKVKKDKKENHNG